MTDYPLEGAERVAFVPPSLANLPTPPSFLLRPGTRRDRRNYQKLLVKEGLQLHSRETFRDETLKGLEALWSPEAFAEYEGRIKAYWDALDQYGKEYADATEPPPFEHPDRDAIDDLTKRITSAWGPLRDMAADTMAFNADSSTIMLSLVLDGWTNLAVAFERADGIVSLDKLEEVEDALLELERKAEKGNIAGIQFGLAFQQLRLEAGRRLYLSKAEEKNSSSPSPSSSTQPISETDGPGNQDGTSQASAISTETPAI